MANEALKPTEHNRTAAKYTNLRIVGRLPGIPVSCAMATMVLRLGAAGQPGQCLLTQPFTAPVSLNPTDVHVSYTENSSPPPSTTVLGTASGRLDTQIRE